MRKLENLINFIVVGTAKAGTTSLFYTIKNIPNFYSRTERNVFFDHKYKFKRATKNLQIIIIIALIKFLI